jgi:hypothetical protein
VPPCQKGRGLLWLGGDWITTSYLFLYPQRDLHDNGSRFRKVDLLRSVGGFYGVWACSRVFQAPSYCSPGPSWMWVSGCLARSLLGGDVFLCGLLVCPWCILGGEVVDAREGFGGDYLVGSAFLGDQTSSNGRWL